MTFFAAPALGARLPPAPDPRLPSPPFAESGEDGPRQTTHTTQRTTPQTDPAADERPLHVGQAPQRRAHPTVVLFSGKTSVRTVARTLFGSSVPEGMLTVTWEIEPRAPRVIVVTFG